MSTTYNISNLSSFAWSIADILRGDFKQSEYGKVIMPFVVLRRLDCILESTKQAVLSAYKALPGGIDDETRDLILYEAVGGNIRVYNTCRFLTFASLKGQEASHLQDNLIEYITSFSPNVRDIFIDSFRFLEQLKRLKDGGILWHVFSRFCEIDLHPDKVTNLEMGYLFEDLIRRFSEISNETAGEHFTPREVIRLIVDLLLAHDHDALTPGIIRTVYDPACGTGGMLAIAEEAILKHNPGKIRVELFGQEINAESYGICKSDMLVTGHNPDQIAFGNTLIEDAHTDRRFHYILSNPPYGVDWKKYQEPIREEYATRGMNGRFGPGLPRVSDGQLLFLLHMISKMRDDEQGSRIGIVMNGAPLFTGAAGSGESEIRRYMFENDLVEAIVALPTDLFYNTGIQTYVWLLNNRKPTSRHRKVQLIDASSEGFWQPLRKSLGSKRREIPKAARDEIVRLYEGMLDVGSGYGEFSKVFDVNEFGYREIRIERPLRLKFQVTEERLKRLAKDKSVLKLEGSEQDDLLSFLAGFFGDEEVFNSRSSFEVRLTAYAKEDKRKIPSNIRKSILNALAERDPDAEICRDLNGNPEPDTELRDHEALPLKESWREYFAREVAAFIPDAWVDELYRDELDKQIGRVGYEINFNRYFYKYLLPRPIDTINAEMKALEAEIAELLAEVAS